MAALFTAQLEKTYPFSSLCCLFKHQCQPDQLATPRIRHGCSLNIESEILLVDLWTRICVRELCSVWFISQKDMGPELNVSKVHVDPVM